MKTRKSFRNTVGPSRDGGVDSLWHSTDGP